MVEKKPLKDIHIIIILSCMLYKKRKQLGSYQWAHLCPRVV